MKFERSNDPLKTSYPYPWALILHYGRVEGQRPRTVLAFIHEALAIDGEIVGFRVTKFPGGNPTKHQAKIPSEYVIHEFRIKRFEKPDRQRIEKARAQVVNRQEVGHA